jgi:hypothetical protein
MEKDKEKCVAIKIFQKTLKNNCFKEEIVVFS